MIRKLVAGYFHLLKVIAVISLVLMVVLVFGNVVLRYGFNQGITVSEELSRWAFVWLTFIGALVVLRDRGHMGVDIALKHMPRWGERISLIISQLLMLACSLLFLRGSWLQTDINWNFPSPVTGLSMGWFYGVGIVFGLSASFIHLYEIFLLIMSKDIRQPDSSKLEAHL
ncbi:MULTISPECIES: TRAP transporter small permease [Pseudomonas]|uniref:TRAP transporter small permease protein n=1 Tax=Pseudomonas luteola TaxID=47886 RepID=A0A2X2F7X4_PSELU|nr:MULTISPECIES: TRAP transporter small permease [Pseudomonas]SHJ37261.1 TRAP-type C4-dicarboxylate transport system, small permease component [Pseudomonas zeshuii]SPZ16819.1 tripartite ATP-independent periplasmic transporter [Pseudomonas luteola]